MQAVTETEFDVDEFSKAYPDGIEKDFWNTARNKLIYNYLKNAGVDNIMDVGCGRGIVTDYLITKGLNVMGVELGVAKPISPKLNIKYNTDALKLPDEIRNGIQAILLLDVIEHIEQPEAFMAGLLQHYPNVKHVLVTVPARKELWSNYDEYYGHFRRYDLKMMEDTMKHVGLTPIKKQYFFHGLYWPLRYNSLLKKEREIKLNAPKGSIAKLIHRIAGNVLYMDAKLLPKGIKGSSVICIARR